MLLESLNIPFIAVQEKVYSYFTNIVTSQYSGI